MYLLTSSLWVCVVCSIVVLATGAVLAAVFVKTCIGRVSY